MPRSEFSQIPREANHFCGCDCPFDQSRLVVFGAPYDASASFRPGARFGPSAMRRDSWGLETYSPLLDKDLEEACVSDLGDLELPQGPATKVLDQVQAMTGAIIRSGKIPVMVGGDHSLTLGAVRAALEAYPQLHIVHLDAHTDLREDYLGDTYSHASVIRRCHDLVGDGRIHAYGIRSGLKTEFDFARQHLDFHPFSLEALADLASTLEDQPVYVTLDLDLLDPSILPGTGTPEPGGIGFHELLSALASTASLKLVGADLMELSPPLDPSGASTAVACKILREWLLLMAFPG
ncbi:MAG: agmatinase [Clostridiaceae bacterium]|nr:agmatinase [Clostridiaceae bacterium]